MRRILIIIIYSFIIVYSMNGQTHKNVARRTTTKKVQTSSNKQQQVHEEREYKVEQDGFEWYFVKLNGKYGAQSKDGKTIIPTEYNHVYYNAPYVGTTDYRYGAFIVIKDGKNGLYNVKGECLIPYTQGYETIQLCCNDESLSNNETPLGVYIQCFKDYQNSYLYVIYGVKGREILRYTIPQGVFITPHYYAGKFFFTFYDNDGNVGIMNGNSNIVYKKKGGHITFENNRFTRLYEIGDDVRSELIGSVERLINTNNNRFEQNLIDTKNYNPYESSNATNTYQQSLSPQQQTIIVEQQRTPVPVQEWQQCTSCYGSGQCPYVKCGGSGWYYIGDKVTTCSRCHGNGKCTTCAGNGGRNVTVYR